MKKIIIIFMCFLQISVFSYSKGLKGGLNYTQPQPQSDDWDTYSGNIGYNLGIFLNIPLEEEYYSFTSELYFNKLSFSFTDIDEDIKEETDTYTSMDFILSINRNFAKNYYFSLGAFFGIPFEYKTIHKAKEEDKPHSYSLNKEDIGFSYGILTGIRYKVNNFIFEARYLINFSSLVAKESLCNFEGRSSHCNSWMFHQIQILAGIEF